MTDRAEERKRRRDRTKAEMIQLGGGKCAVCGSKDRLQFHHFDPTTKITNVGRIFNGARGRILTEMKKCVLLCYKHHLEAHNRGVAKHGTRRNYHNGCRCSECTKAQRLYQRDYMKRRKQGAAAGCR
jgi:hypothetical protein